MAASKSCLEKMSWKNEIISELIPRTRNTLQQNQNKIAKKKKTNLRNRMKTCLNHARMKTNAAQPRKLQGEILIPPKTNNQNKQIIKKDIFFSLLHVKSSFRASFKKETIKREKHTKKTQPTCMKQPHLVFIQIKNHNSYFVLNLMCCL